MVLENLVQSIRFALTEQLFKISIKLDIQYMKGDIRKFPQVEQA